MEGGPARLMNLADVANRIEKLISDAHQNCERITEAGDILLGAEPTDAANKANAPAPSALLHRIGQNLGILESIMNNQRQALHRLHNGLQEPPAKNLSNTVGQAQSASGLQSRY